MLFATKCNFLIQICRKLTHNENNAQSRVVGKLSFLHQKIDNFRNWFFFLKSKY